MNQTQELAAAVRQYEKTIADTRKRFTQAVVGKESPAEIAKMSSELAGMSEGLEALSQALNDAREQEQRDEAEQRRADVKARAKGFVQKFKARRESYAHLQQASTAFLEALRNHLTGGALLRTEAVSVAGHGGMISIPDVAGGVARADALALATTLREAIVMFGQPRLMSQYIAVNDFAKPVSFVEAHEANAALVGRLA